MRISLANQKTQQHRFALWAGVFLLNLWFVPACSSGSNGPSTTDALSDGPSVTTDVPTSCEVLWTVAKVGSVQASIQSGALSVTGANLESFSRIDITNLAEIQGDFDVSFNFEKFVAGGTGAFVQAVVSVKGADGKTPFAIAGIGTHPVVGISAAFPTDGTSDIQPTSDTNGTFRIQRTGSMVTVSTTTKGAKATKSANLGDGAARIGLQLGNNGPNKVATESSISVTDFIVMQGKGISGDSFLCNSLKP